jgi:hypothetical protein
MRRLTRLQRSTITCLVMRPRQLTKRGAVHHEAGGLARVVAHVGRHHLAAAEAAVGEQREDGTVPRLALAGHDLLDLAPVEDPG